MMLLLAALLALQTPANLPIGAASAEIDQSASHRAAALRLVELNYPKEALLIFQSDYPSQFAKGMVQTPAGARIEERYPGFALRFAKRAHPVTKGILASKLPILHQQLADFYALQMNSAEVAEMTAFVSSAAGKKFVGDARARVQIGTLVQGATPSTGVSEEAYQDASREAARTALKNVPPAELSEIVRFISSPTGRKAVQVENDARPLLVTWADTYAPEAEAQINGIMMSVMKEIAAEQAAGRRSGR